MLVCRKLQIQFVIFESNCFHVIAATNQVKMLDSKLFSIIHDIHCFMEQCPNWKIFFTYREANSIAHILAKFALNLD